MTIVDQAREVDADDPVTAQGQAIARAVGEGHVVVEVRSVRLQKPGDLTRKPRYIVRLGVEPRTRGCDCE